MFLLIAIVVIIAIFVFSYIFRTYNYWTVRNVPQADLWTTLRDVLRLILNLETPVHSFNNIYSRCKNYRYFGSYRINEPALLIRDQDLIKSIAVKDFDYFTDHGDLGSTTHDPLWARNLIALHGEKWRAMRATLSPAFTSSKMRAMFVLMDESARKYVNFYKNGASQLTLELRDSFTCLSNDVIANCIIGLECDSLRNPDNQVYLMGKEATNFSGFIKSFKMLLALTLPKFADILKIRLYSPHVHRFYSDLITRALRLRQEQNIHRPDMIHLLLEARKGLLKFEEELESTDGGFAVLEEAQFLKNKKQRLIQLTDEDITAQIVTFLGGGFHTMATVLSFASYELGLNSEIQDKLRVEIEDHLATANGKLSYDIIGKMKYLDMVVSEVLRKWPPAFVSERKCTKSYTIPKKHDHENDVILNPGDTIFMPIFAIHRDPDIYPEPESFDPERFTDDNKHLLTPYNYMPFGVGPRHCIAIRFALLELKTILVHLLSNFNIVPIERTQIPLKLKMSIMTLAAEKGFWFELKRRN